MKFISILFAIVHISYSCPNFHGKRNIVVLSNEGLCTYNVALVGEESTWPEYMGDNSNLITTDTLKNVVYSSIKKGKDIAEIVNVSFRGKSISNTAVERLCSSIDARHQKIRKFSDGQWMRGFQNLNLFKMNNSAFENFSTDNNYTTLNPTSDRPLYLIVSAQWTSEASVDQVIDIVRESFHSFSSNSVQHLLNQTVDVLREKLGIDNVHFWVKNIHYIKLSEKAIVPLYNEYGYFSISFSK